MGRQLTKIEKNYRDRCTFRNRPHHKGDNVILPGIFPPPSPSPEKEVLDNDITPELPKEHLENVRDMYQCRGRIYQRNGCIIDSLSPCVSLEIRIEGNSTQCTASSLGKFVTLSKEFLNSKSSRSASIPIH